MTLKISAFCDKNPRSQFSEIKPRLFRNYPSHNLANRLWMQSAVLFACQSEERLGGGVVEYYAPEDPRWTWHRVAWAWATRCTSCMSAAAATRTPGTCAPTPRYSSSRTKSLRSFRLANFDIFMRKSVLTWVASPDFFCAGVYILHFIFPPLTTSTSTCMPRKDKDVPYIIFYVKYTGRYNVQCTVPYLEPDP